MANTPSPALQQPTNPNVAMVLQDLRLAGAVPVESSFSVAGSEQAEVIYKNHRYLITPNDEAYRRYVTEMERAGLRFVGADAELSNDTVAVGEISRTARAIPQVLRGNQPRGGQTINEVFFTLGVNLNILAQRSQVAPKAGNLVLQKILILRGENDVMIAPPLEFEQVSEASKQKLIEDVQRQLFPDYAGFGATALLSSFEIGLSYDTSKL